MTAVYDQEVRDAIDLAFERAEAGQREIAVLQFALARTLSFRLADPSALKTVQDKDRSAYVKEREVYRKLIPEKPDASRKLLLIADSLGLPRPNDKEGPLKGAERTYTGLIDAKFEELRVTSICQRFLSTTEVVDLLQEDEDLGRGSDVLIHVGLNDCANRMFLEAERLSLALLSVDTRKRVIEFSRLYRRDILQNLPPHHYTTIENFRKNLDMCVSLLKERDAGRITLTTIILPPARSWPGTPGMNRNFATYNLAIMDATHRHQVGLFDLDRHIWQAQGRKVLLDDGMHLSDTGHQLFVTKCDPFIR